MIKEAIQYQFERGVDAGKKELANKVNFHDRLGDPRTIAYEFNGVIEHQAVPPALRDHHVDSVEDLIEAAKKWGEAGEDDTEDGVIWLSRSKVVLITNDQDRRERVTLDLTLSQVFLQIVKLVGNPNLDQAGLIRLLRRDFRHAPQVNSLLTAVRKMKFSSRSSAHSDMQHGNESLGNAIEAEVTGAEDIADMLIVPTPIFMNPGEEEVKFSVTLDLEIIVANRQHPFVLRPMPDEIDAAFATALNSIKERLKDALPEMTVLYGTP